MAHRNQKASGAGFSEFPPRFLSGRDHIFKAPMTDKRQHRGPHPKDAELFSGDQIAVLQAAVADNSTLLSKGYSENASLKLVGDHFALRQRQRMAVARSSCSNSQASSRQQKRIRLDSAESLTIDGFNLLITIEAALAGGFIIIGKDGAWRDIAGMHGSFRTVEETTPALTLIGQHLSRKKKITWLLDSPVSNSARVRQLMLDLALTNHWNWDVELVRDPDHELKKCPSPVVTADSIILDHCHSWVNLANEIIEASIPKAWVADLHPTPST